MIAVLGPVNFEPKFGAGVGRSTMTLLVWTLGAIAAIYLTTRFSFALLMRRPPSI
jgi:hypothetical protein